MNNKIIFFLLVFVPFLIGCGSYAIAQNTSPSTSTATSTPVDVSIHPLIELDPTLTPTPLPTATPMPTKTPVPVTNCGSPDPHMPGVWSQTSEEYVFTPTGGYAANKLGIEVRRPGQGTVLQVFGTLSSQVSVDKSNLQKDDCIFGFDYVGTPSNTDDSNTITVIGWSDGKHID